MALKRSGGIVTSEAGVDSSVVSTVGLVPDSPLGSGASSLGHLSLLVERCNFLECARFFFVFCDLSMWTGQLYGRYPFGSYR